MVWTLDRESEANVILPWVLSNPPRSDREAVAAWLEVILTDPFKPGLEDPQDVFSVVVPGTNVTMVWTIDPAARVVFVAVLR